MRNFVLLLVVSIVIARTTLNPTRVLQEEPPKGKNYTLLDEGIYKSKNTTYDLISTQCNFFVDEELVVAPWPDNCKIFQRKACYFYEVSKDGKSIESCQPPNPNCTDESDTLLNKCTEFHETFSSVDSDGI
eukprot:CAMPEP_0170479570 /NCGR_PEP_ID=MMETSP0208-20121228/760_1 /TAXON_ID=197538 /ORGANISM="Strombidium inclinatum, Strain S3" /LENGTH=130 /DNA_ID=CAMNT_0010751991 /DNA_START=8 /DNA_END=400 /DNA_ORIENTATION=+